MDAVALLILYIVSNLTWYGMYLHLLNSIERGTFDYDN